MFKLTIAVVLLLGCVCTNGQALTPEEIAEIKRLQAALDALTSRARRQSTEPTITTSQGNLTFVAPSGKRIAYKIGDEDEVSFDDLVKTDTQIGLLLQTVHQGAIATGKVMASADFIQENMSVAVTDAKIQAAIGNLEGKLQPILGNATTSIAVLEAQVKMLSQSSSSLYWYDTFVYFGEEPGKTSVSDSAPYINIAGVGFEEMFHPSASGQFICKFVAGADTSTSSGSLASTVSPAGGEFVHLLCPLPKSWRIDTEVTVSVWSHDGSEVSFEGATGANKFIFGEPMYYDVVLVSKYPQPPEYLVKGTFVVGDTYKCQFIGNTDKIERSVRATSKASLDCGAGPTSAISNDVGSVKPGEGTCVLNIFDGNKRMHGTTAKNIKYYNCQATAGMADCITGCPIEGSGGQALFDSPGTGSWTATFCGTVSVVAVGSGGGGGYQWSSGGGGGGGVGWIRSYPVTKGSSYKVVVGAGGPCSNNAGNSQVRGETSYFVSTNVVAGYGGGRGGPGSSNSRPYDGGGFKGDGGGRGGYGGGGRWTGGGGGAGGYTNRGGDAQGCSNGNRGCDAPADGGGGGAGGYYSSTYGTPAGGGVGLYGKGTSGKGDYQQASTGGSGGEPGIAGEGGAGNPRSRCAITGGKFGGGGGGSGTSYGGGVGGSGAVRLVWGQNRVYPNSVPDV
eukprot:m.256203 g.256203  ORF g.256203 m.256203 type:complete len:675 (-) comp34177_c0_seq1:118-2142(-)